MPGYTFDAFKLGLDYNNSILFLDRRDMFIHEGFGNSQYFKFLLLDRNRKEKISINLSGKDKANDKKYDKLDNFNFEIGDYVVIYHAEPSRLNFSNTSGPVGLSNKDKLSNPVVVILYSCSFLFP